MIDLVPSLRLYLVADPDHCNGDLVDQTEAAIRGGVTMVQLRAKHLTDLELFSLAQKMRSVCSRHGVPLLLNDRVDIALAVGADGVHLGVDDLPIEAARSIGGSVFVVGFSPETDDHVRMAASRGADYLGIGPVFGTATKTDAGSALGIEQFAHRCAIADLPVVGIGGIQSSNFRNVLEKGAAGVAVVSAILQADDAESAARQLSRN